MITNLSVVVFAKEDNFLSQLLKSFVHVAQTKHLSYLGQFNMLR